ncbi:MAG: hypothetical protein PWP65_1088 [Clostridia bacterium]|nr:hypothetical protein [Clostridia bacterium]
MPEIKLVAIDLDGTLLDDDTRISGRSREAIRATRAAGVEVTLATGRMFCAALPFARELGLNLPLITYQGALVKNSGTGEVLYARFLSPDLARRIIRKIKSYGFPFNVYLDDFLCTEEDSPALREYTRKNRVPFQIAPDMLQFVGDREPIKILVMEDPDKLNALEADCRREFGGQVHMTRSFPYYLEFVHPEANKARGLEAVARYLRVAREEIMAIGDSFNDLEMFQYAGLAVAMGNAPEEVKAAAVYVTGTNNDGGVAEALERFILKGPV